MTQQLCPVCRSGANRACRSCKQTDSTENCSCMPPNCTCPPAEGCAFLMIATVAMTGVLGAAGFRWRR